MTYSNDPRDRITDHLQRLVDAAADDPAVRERLDQLWFSEAAGTELPGGWRKPSDISRNRARSLTPIAARAALTAMDEMRVGHLDLSVASLPKVTPRAKPVALPRGFCPAPLVASLVEPSAARHLHTVAAYVYSNPTLPANEDLAEDILVPEGAEPLFSKDIRLHLYRRLNAFALLESNLWWYASLGGYPDPPPYAVRYQIARWLWHPESPGTFMCLRCGTTRIYTRHERRTSPRTARCRSCSRGRGVDWPTHAIEPHRRGTWLLRCGAPKCDVLFTGRRQARYCEQHRLNAVTPAERGQAFGFEKAAFRTSRVPSPRTARAPRRIPTPNP